MKSVLRLWMAVTLMWFCPTMASLEQIEGWEWTWPFAYREVYDHALAEHLPDLGKPERIGEADHGHWFSIEYMGVVSLTDGERPLDYFRRGRVAYLRDFEKKLKAIADAARFLAEKDVEVIKPDFILHTSHIVTQGEYAYLRYVTEVDAMYSAKALILMGEHAVHAAFYNTQDDRMLAEMRLDSFLYKVRQTRP